MREIANTIERDIARALQPKPEKVQEDYWTIYEQDCFGSYHSYKDFMSYDHYPYNADVLELSNETIDAMKEAYRQIRIAEIYATRVDWMMSGDDSEESFRERIKEDLEEFEKEYVSKDWTNFCEGD